MCLAVCLQGTYVSFSSDSHTSTPRPLRSASLPLSVQHWPTSQWTNQSIGWSWDQRFRLTHDPSPSQVIDWHWLVNAPGKCFIKRPTSLLHREDQGLNIGTEVGSSTLLVKYTLIFIILYGDILSLFMSQHTPIYKYRMELKQRWLVNTDK